MRIRVAVPVILIGMVGAIMASCGGGEKVAGPSQQAIPAQLEIVAGNNQTAPVATELAGALVVRVLDAAGAPISGQLVNFRITKGGGSVFSGSALTGADGVAQERWTLGTVARDTQQVEARAIDSRTGEKIVFAVFKAVGQAGAPVELRKVVGDNQPGVVGAALPESLVVRLVDAYGNGESGNTVTWTTGSGSLSAAASTTDTAGRTAVRWTLGTAAGPQQSTARAGTLPAVIFAATARGGAPTSIARMTVDGGEYTVGSAVGDSVGVRVTDAYGNPSAGATVTFSAVSGGGNTSPASGVTNAEGIARTRWVLGTRAGINRLRVVAAVGVETEFTATGRAGAPATVAKVADEPAAAIVGTQLSPPPTVEVRDDFGNPVAGVSVSFTVTAGGGTASGATPTTGADGRAAVGSWTLGTVAGSNSLTATVTGLAPVTFTVFASPGPVAHVRIDTHPETLYVGKTMQLTATSTDAYGNPRSDVVAWSVPLSSQSRISITSNGLVTATDDGWPRVVATVGAVADTAALVTIYRVTRVEVRLGRSRLHAGDTTRATVRLFANNEEVIRPYSVASEDTTFAVVDTSGIVTGRANGRVDIVAESEGRIGYTALDVVPHGARSVTIDPRSVTLIGHQTLQLTATVIDSLGQAITDPPVFWASSDLAIAEISPAGIVYPKAVGRATIRALLDGGADSIPVEVVNGPVVRVYVSSNSLYPGDSTLVHAQAKDEGGNTVPGKTFTWSSSDSSRLLVTGGPADLARIVALRAGSVNISASVDGVTGSAPWTVLPLIVWQQMASPTTQSISAVWGRSIYDVYAAAPGGVLHFNGSSWTDMGSGTAYERFWSTSATNLFARIGGALFQYDGTRWSEVPLTPPSGPFKKVWASSVDDVWGIFFDGALARDRLAHLSGGVWTVSDLMNGMSDIWGTGISGVWVTGENGQSFNFNGVEWHRISDLGAGNTGEWIWSNRRPYARPYAWIYFQGNSSGHLSQFGDPAETQIYWSGAAHGNTFTAPQALWSSELTDVYTIQDGTLYRFPGPNSPRRALVELTGPGYRGVWGENRVIFAVGDGGIIMRGELAYLR